MSWLKDFTKPGLAASEESDKVSSFAASISIPCVMHTTLCGLGGGAGFGCLPIPRDRTPRPDKTPGRAPGLRSLGNHPISLGDPLGWHGARPRRLESEPPGRRARGRHSEMIKVRTDRK